MSVIKFQPGKRSLEHRSKNNEPDSEQVLNDSYQQGLAIIQALQEALESAYQSGRPLSLAVVTSQSPNNQNRNVWFSNTKTLEERLGLLEMGKMLMYLEL